MKSDLEMAMDEVSKIQLETDDSIIMNIELHDGLWNCKFSWHDGIPVFVAYYKATLEDAIFECSKQYAEWRV